MLEAGTLEPLKDVRMKHYSFLAPVLGIATHWLTIIVSNGLEKFQKSLQNSLELQRYAEFFFIPKLRSLKFVSNVEIFKYNGDLRLQTFA